MFKKSASAPDLLPGTLEMLILRTVSNGPEHGYGIAATLKRQSSEVLQVGEGSLYPALQRLLVNGLVKSEWKISGANRRARYYSITAAGRKQLTREAAQFDRMVEAIRSVMQPA